jgi:hypothetical protein
MTPFITYTLLAFMAAYGVVLLVELIATRSIKRFAVQAVLLGLVFVLLHVTVNFPTPRRAFGGASLLAAVALILVCTILGMAAQFIFSMGESRWSWGGLVRPFVISPIVLLPLLGSILGSEQLNTVQLISFSFLAFQNGFFWRVVLERASPKM